MATPAARRAERRKNLIALGIAALIVVAAGLFAWRPVAFPVMSVSGESLAQSVQGEFGDIAFHDPRPCERESEHSFTCRALIPEDSGGVETIYSVHAEWTGCWRAEPLRKHIGAPEERTATAEIDGCISIFDI